jgi:hypothetical protein
LADLSGAQTALDAIWPRFVRDVYSGSPDMTNLATAPVISILVGVFSCGCLYLSPKWTSDELTAPAQTSYPLEVLAELDNPHGVLGVKEKHVTTPFKTFVVLEKPSPSDDWVVAYVAGNGSTVDPLAPTSPSTMATPPQPATSFARSFDQLAQAMTSARNTGRIPDDNIWRSVDPKIVPGDTMKDLEEDYRADLVTHEHQVGGYTVGAASQVFTVPAGTMECAYIYGSATFSGQVFVQPLDQSAWGPLLRSGRYSRIVVSSIRDACIVKTFSTGDVFIGMNGGVFHESGVAAP